MIQEVLSIFTPRPVLQTEPALPNAPATLTADSFADKIMPGPVNSTGIGAALLWGGIIGTALSATGAAAAAIPGALFVGAIAYALGAANRHADDLGPVHGESSKSHKLLSSVEAMATCGGFSAFAVGAAATACGIAAPVLAAGAGLAGAAAGYLLSRGAD